MRGRGSGAARSHRAEFVQCDLSSERSRPVADQRLLDRPLAAVLCAPGDFVRDSLAAGQALATGPPLAHVEGARASYLNQPVQEPAVLVPLRDELCLPGPAQLVLRFRRGSDVAPPQRGGVHDVTFTAGPAEETT
jgi:hypothetical protein